MSFKAMDLVMKASVPGPAGAKLVLLSLAHRCRADTGYSCWPSQARLALDTNQSERSVRAHLHALEEAGYITRTSRSRSAGRTSDRITVVLSRLTADEPVDDAPAEAPEVEPDEVQPADSAVANRQILPGQPADIAGEQVSEHSNTSPLVGGGGGVAEVSTEQHQRHNPVTPDGLEFPLWAREALGDITPAAATQWRQAWQTVHSIVNTVWDPTLHLTKYLARCRELRRVPSPTDWMRWYAEDDQKARADGASRKTKTDTITTNPYWE